MNEKSTVAASGVIAPPEATPHRRLHWWVEALITLVFYVIYSAIRNQFGSLTFMSAHSAHPLGQLS